MALALEEGEVATGTTGLQEAVTPACLTTMLYELMTALQERLGTGKDVLVVPMIGYRVRAGWLPWGGKPRAPRYRTGVGAAIRRPRTGQRPPNVLGTRSKPLSPCGTRW